MIKKFRLIFLMYACIVFLVLFSTFSTQADSLKIICSTDNDKNSLHVTALEKFHELVHKYSNGRLTTEIHYRGNTKFPAIRSEEINVNMLMSSWRIISEVNVTVVAAGNLSQKAPVLDFLMLPYMFSDIESAKNLFQSDFMLEKINSIIAKKHNIRALGWLIGGFRHLTNSKRPVTRIEDIKGLIIRTPKNRLMHDTYRSFGAKPVAVSWADTFNALKIGRVDGQENPYNVILYSKFWDANQKYITNNGPFLWVGPILISEIFYQSLTSEQQIIVKKAGLEASRYEWEWITKRNVEFKQALVKNGMQISDLEDKQKWVEAVRPIWKRYRQLIGYGNRKKGLEIILQALKYTRKDKR